MGCDIHAYVETKNATALEDAEWSYLCDYHFVRNYALFALMAGVRRYSSWPSPGALEKALQKRGVNRLDDPKLSLNEANVIMLEGADTGLTRGQPSFEPKGMPKNISHKTVDDFTIYVLSDDANENEWGENTCKREIANKWVENGSCVIWDCDKEGNPLRITSPDWHGESWLDNNEVRELAQRCAKLYDDDPDDNTVYELFTKTLACVEALDAMMHALEARGFKARLVFWFDN